MPQAVSVAIAQGVADQIGQINFGDEPIEAERSYADWELGLTDAGELHVDVVAVTTEQKTELVARGARARYTVPIDIAVRYRFGEQDQDDQSGRIDVAKIDGLVLLVEQIHEQFLPNRLTEFTDAVWVETKILVCPLLKHLRELRQFTGIVRVTFEAVKDLAPTG